MLEVRGDLNERMLVVGAVRYYMGRHTIAVHGFCDWLRGVWDGLDDVTRIVVYRDAARWLGQLPDQEDIYGGVDDAAPFRAIVDQVDEADRLAWDDAVSDAGELCEGGEWDVCAIAPLVAERTRMTRDEIEGELRDLMREQLALWLYAAGKGE